MTVVCPHCTANQPDDEWEVLSLDELASMCCTTCSRIFVLLLKECGRCGEETAFAWRKLPSPEVVGALTCSYCSRRLRADE